MAVGPLDFDFYWHRGSGENEHGGILRPITGTGGDNFGGPFFVVGKNQADDCAHAGRICRAGVEADALATAVFVLGNDGGLEIIRARPGVEALVVTEEADGRLTIAVWSGMRRRFLPVQVEARPPGE